MANIKDAVFADYMATTSGSSAGPRVVEGTNLLVNYLPFDMQERELTKMFKNFGQLKQVKIIRDAETGASHCYGFVNYMNSGQAHLALISVNGRQVRGKRLKVSFARPASADIKNAKLYVANLPVDYDAAKVHALFERYGKILDLNLLKDRFTGQSRGVAFVRYELRSAADLAMSAMNDFLLVDGHLPLQVKLAKRPMSWELPKNMLQDHDQPGQPVEPQATKHLLMETSSTDVSLHSEKGDIKQFKRPMCFRFGQMENSTADSTASSKPSTFGDYNLLMNVNFGQGRKVTVVPKDSPDLATTNQQDQAKSPDVPSKWTNSSSDYELAGNSFDNTKNFKKNTTLRHAMLYKFPSGHKTKDLSAPTLKQCDSSFDYSWTHGKHTEDQFKWKLHI